MAGHYEKAKGAAMQYQDIFGRGNFYLEIQDQGLEQEKKIQSGPLPAREGTRYSAGR